MNIIVVGSGRVGAQLALSLEHSGHAVTVIDKNASTLSRLAESFSGKCVHGSGFDLDDLRAAGIDQADALAAVTTGDNTNILTARIAREVCNVPRVVARIYDPRRAVIYERLGIPTVATVTWTTDQVRRRLEPEKAEVEWTAPAGDLQLIERILPDHWAGRSLAELTNGDSHRLVAVRHGAHARIVSDTTLAQAGDIVYIAVRSDAEAALQTILDTVPARKAAH